MDFLQLVFFCVRKGMVGEGVGALSKFTSHYVYVFIYLRNNKNCTALLYTEGLVNESFFCLGPFIYLSN